MGLPSLLVAFAGANTTGLAAVWFLFGVPAAFLSALIARIAERRGRNWFLFLWLSVVFSPLIMGLVVAFAGPDQPALTTPAPHAQGDSLDKLERLAKLKDSGAISEAEYEDKKRALLDEV